MLPRLASLPARTPWPSEAAQTYANLLVVEEGNENEPAIKALVAALTSQTVKDYIDSTYDGAVVAIF